MEPKWNAVECDALVVKGSFRQLAREIGYNVTSGDGGKLFIQLRKCIERLWTVSIIVSIGSYRQGFRLLSEYASDDREGKLFVALNPRIAAAIMGGRYTRIELHEIRQFRSDAARLIHQRLCGFVDPKKTSIVKLDTLVSYVFPGAEGMYERAAKADSERWRRRTVREALAEIAAVGWKIRECSTHRYEIRRPAVLGNVEEADTTAERERAGVPY
jgi:hypothetical protein